ncbi:hypothetical protein [Burkholderia pyrrocinia]|uniref:hypothetical protein n=1 Tax=Burkholderia pyrrocinia TaxID=60550 RepID=UPI001375304E|nr:hypothetical protein [Burkholderia pyrrocinia]
MVLEIGRRHPAERLRQDGFAVEPLAVVLQRDGGVALTAVDRRGTANCAMPMRLPAGLVVAAHLAGVAAGIVAIAALATLLALLFR